MLIELLKLLWIIICFVFIVALKLVTIFTGFYKDAERDTIDSFCKLLLGWDKDNI